MEHLTSSQRPTIPTSGLRGRARMTSSSALLNDKAVAGNPSVTKLTHSSCTGESVDGKPSVAAVTMATTSPILLLTMYRMNCFVLAKMQRPSATAATIVAKLSSMSTISEACLATAVPDPIAMPMSARRRAGASLTPSPVMATTCTGGQRMKM